MKNFPGMKVKVKFLESFKDGNIFGSKNFTVNEVAVLDETQYNLAKQSGAMMEVVERIVPNPKKVEK